MVWQITKGPKSADCKRDGRGSFDLTQLDEHGEVIADITVNLYRSAAGHWKLGDFRELRSDPHLGGKVSQPFVVRPAVLVQIWDAILCYVAAA